MDRRLTPANVRVAASELRGRIDSERYVDGTWRAIGSPVSDLLREPDGQRDSQLVYGERFRVLEVRGGYAFGQAARDGYVGYIPESVLMDAAESTHFVTAPATHAYPAPDIKQREIMGLSFGAQVRVVSASGSFFETQEGFFLPKPHLRPLNAPLSDPVSVAQLFFGVPYLWGGRSARGIDCSGLVQMALWACGVDCPRDSDMQEQALGTALPAGTPAERSDLFFWKGHVAMAVDPDTLIHANAHHMAVAYEPIAVAISRIQDQGEGPVTSHRRR